MTKQLLATKTNIGLYLTKPGLMCRCIACSFDAPANLDNYKRLANDQIIKCPCGRDMNLVTRKVIYSYLETE